jgi:transcriptional regulator with XRE-family HTH domain
MPCCAVMNTTDRVLLGQRLCAARHARGLTVAQLADASGVFVDLIGAIERGSPRPTGFTTVAALARVLDIAPSWLLSSDPDAPGGL